MKSIIVQPVGGLCNRMRTILGASELAKKLDGKLVVIWTSDPSLNIPFSELFTPPPGIIIRSFPMSSGDFIGKVKFKSTYFLYKNLMRYQIIDDKWIYKYARNKEYCTWQHLLCNRIYIKSCVDIISGSDYSSLFQPNMKMLSDMNTVICDKSTIGIHIRRTDNANSIKFSPTVLFINKVREEIKNNPKVKFYLATDSPEEENTFRNEFGDRIIIYDKHSLDRNSPLAIKDALVDLYNLSCCRKILASYYSSFSSVAALWGNIEKEVIKTNS